MSQCQESESQNLNQKLLAAHVDNDRKLFLSDNKRVCWSETYIYDNIMQIFVFFFFVLLYCYFKRVSIYFNKLEFVDKELI